VDGLNILLRRKLVLVAKFLVTIVLLVGGGMLFRKIILMELFICIRDVVAEDI
jgi:hypothetical protein